MKRVGRFDFNGMMAVDAFEYFAATAFRAGGASWIGCK